MNMAFALSAQITDATLVNLAHHCHYLSRLVLAFVLLFSAARVLNFIIFSTEV